ncbi:hypothetical protein [Mycobacteroides abscessus]|uniref:hypothetical protein n=1 Tax=Mycobacteroides abscessus TaxID=36809 RepID=UPI0009285196|nr:hypothetical protein [Mycobacteroides abscessus]DAZ90315.1 TPA_asm: hypothetical protein PROPHIFSQJ01-1_29 [Mycobacterium phage prophiFSQJ01-1]SII40646.1 Uncharacterised protein [Mycobacteroides abscessus subsp. abscessus]SIK14582.1 Uncharacterised protein [Mycobacteroides abscessus subsp. abscessus]SIN25155.1 Uncharacterised protein [Mycobacteroides abscessus subsp. abscessus]SLI51805.1 Uncharacterised protein [Mycobacteroides abscessus subsp. abscessus]
MADTRIIYSFPGPVVVLFVAICHNCDFRWPCETREQRDQWVDGHGADTGHNITTTVEVHTNRKIPECTVTIAQASERH